jgi:hypothetical protein
MHMIFSVLFKSNQSFIKINLRFRVNLRCFFYEIYRRLRALLIHANLYDANVADLITYGGGQKSNKGR